MKSKENFSTCLIVGRFQPFHYGHLYLLRQALEIADKIVIAVGSADSNDEQNPLSFSIRKKMLQQVVNEEGISSQVTKIVPIQDYPSDEQWLKKLIEVAGEFEVAMGNNDWTNDILEKAGYEVVTVPELKRNVFQGTVIRQLAADQQEWQQRVPSYLLPMLEDTVFQQ